MIYPLSFENRFVKYEEQYVYTYHIHLVLSLLLENTVLKLHEYYMKGRRCMHKFPIYIAFLHVLFLNMEVLSPD